MNLICSIPNCGHLAEKNGICGRHNREARKSAAPKEKPKRQRIAKQSDEGKDRQLTYLAIRTLYLAQFPNCAVCEDDGKGVKATDIHHRKGRLSDLLYDPRFFIGVCRNCHQWIEDNPVDAIESGWSLSRHAIETHSI